MDMISKELTGPLMVGTGVWWYKVIQTNEVITLDKNLAPALWIIKRDQAANMMEAKDMFMTITQPP